jgi:hypothetical protein
MQGTAARFVVRAALGLSFLMACGGAEDRAPPLADNPVRPVPGCERNSYTACDILAADCEKNLFGLMACLRGEDTAGLNPPPVQLLSEADAAAVLQGQPDAPAQDLDPDFLPSVRGLELLGLLAPGLITSQADVVDVSLEQVLAFYLPETRSIVIIDRGTPLDSLDADEVLGHEFVHALQDTRHHLLDFGTDPALDSDQSLALTSVVEGDAVLYQLLLSIAHRGLSLDAVDYPTVFSSLTSSGDQASLDAGSPMITASDIFPYTYGARYAGERWLSEGRQRPDSLFDDPPGSTLEVLWGDAPGAVPSPHELDAPSAPLDGYRLVTDDAAGAWVTFCRALEAANDLRLAPALVQRSERWRGDHFWVYQSQDDAAQVAVVWLIDWADADTSRQFAAGLSGFQPAGGVLQIDVADTRTRIVAVERSSDLAGWVSRAAEASP